MAIRMKPFKTLAARRSFIFFILGNLLIVFLWRGDELVFPTRSNAEQNEEQEEFDIIILLSSWTACYVPGVQLREHTLVTPSGRGFFAEGV